MVIIMLRRRLQQELRARVGPVCVDVGARGARPWGGGTRGRRTWACPLALIIIYKSGEMTALDIVIIMWLFFNIVVGLSDYYDIPAYYGHFSLNYF